VEPTLWPATREERIKLILSLNEMTKADLKAGSIKDWGCEPGGWSGYGISEGLSETQLNTSLLKYTGIRFEVMPVLTIDQSIESFNKAVESMKKAAASATK